MSDKRLNFALCAVCAASLFLALLWGSTPLAPGDVASALFGGGDIGARIIIWEIRMPRALAALLVGAALGLSGAALQGLLRNPLADPGVLGVSATAALFATVTLYFNVAQNTPLAVGLAAILGAMVATAVLALAAMRTGSVVTLLLIGVGLSSFSGALMALLMNLAPNPFSLSDMVNWMLGSLANRSMVDLALAAPFFCVGAAILLFRARDFSVLTLGEEAAHGMGLDLGRARIAIVIGAGLATGAAVGLAGAVGFVGLAAPHLVRPFVGHDPGRTLLPAALLGACLLLFADMAVRILPSESELKIGVIAALLGAPVFIWIAAARGGRDG